MSTMITAADATGPTPIQIAKSVLWRNKFKILMIPAAVMLLAALVILYFPRTYYSDARLFLRVGRESIGLDPTATTGQVIGLQQQGQESEVLSAIDLIGSRGVLGRVVDELGPDYILRGGPEGQGGGKPINPFVETLLDYAVYKPIEFVRGIDPISDRERAIITCERGLDLESEKNSTVIIVRFEAASPRGAQETAEKIVEVYLQEHLRVHRNQQSRGFFDEQRTRFQQELLASQEKLRDAKNRMGIASLDARRGALEERLQSIELERFRTEQGLATAQARIDMLEQQVGATPARMLASKRLVPNLGADALRDRLYELQLREMELTSKYSDSHPLVRAATAQLAEAKRVVERQTERREETTDDVNPIHRELSLTLSQEENAASGLRARIKMLDGQHARVTTDLEQLNRYEVELQELDQEVEIARAKRMRYEEDYEQARIDRALEDEKISSVAVAQAPTYNQKPANPSKLLVLLGAVLASFGLTGSWVFAKEQLTKPIASSNLTLLDREGAVSVARDTPQVRVVYTRVARDAGGTTGASV